MAHDDMTTEQSLELQRLNDNYSVARWERDGSDLHVWCDDGDEALIDPSGYTTWKSVAS
jgi:hypothetical protein